MSPAFWPYSCPHFHRSLYACKVARARRCTAFSHWEPCYADLGPWGAWRAGLAQLQDEGTYGMIWVQPRPVADPGRPWQTPFVLFNAVGICPDECPFDFGEWGAWRAGLAQLQDEGTYGMIWVQPRPVADPGRPWQTPFVLFNAVGWSP